MRPVLTAEEMRRADRHAIDDLGLPGAVLMENAGGAVVAQIQRRHPGARPVILCGKGNNGGDGFVVAHRLLASSPRVFLLGHRDDVKGDARIHLEAYVRSGGGLTEIADADDPHALREALAGADLIVDALLGTGLTRAPEGPIAAAIAAMAAARRSGVPVIAVDLPSGVSSDTGTLPGPVAGADLTVTFAALKRGHVLPPACNVVGEVIVADIGIPVAGSEARAGLIEAQDVAAALGARTPDAHKGDLGHLLVVAGSLGKSGAAVLAGVGALRMGAGLVTVATPSVVQPVVAASRPELMTEPLPAGERGFAAEALDAALELAGSRDAAVLGPGIGQSPDTLRFAREFVRRCPVPLLVDADGLNALAGESSLVLERERPTVLTPHPGEMARLLGITTKQVQADRVEAAARLGRETGAVVVLKGQRTLVVDPGGCLAVNPTGNPGLASGGTGDVLAGMIGALLARGLDPDRAAAVGVYLHGAAGDVAAETLGQESTLAGDLLDHLGAAILKATGA